MSTPISSISSLGTDAGSGASPVDGTTSAQQNEVQQAFQQGVGKFMQMVLQSAESDVTEAINDETSTPDSNG